MSAGETHTVNEDAWPWFDCPECGHNVWLDGFDDATTVKGEGDYRIVRHCGVCEFVAIRKTCAPPQDAVSEEKAGGDL